MIDRMYDEMTLERDITQRFGLDTTGMQIIAYKIPVSHTGEATVFLNSKKQLFVYIFAEANLVLADIKKIVARMHLKAETYLPPKGRPQYFDEVGTRKFREVFPGRSHVGESDIAYYRTLTPYNPALVAISEVEDGAIYRFDADATGGWRPSVKFTYRRIRTS